MSTVFLSLRRQPDGAIEIQYSVATDFTSTDPNQKVLVQTQLGLYGPHMTLTQCPGLHLCRAVNGPGGQEIVITFPQTSSRQQIESAVVSDPSLGFTYNNESAVAEMPYVSLESLPLNTTGPSGPSSPPNSMPFSVNFGFDVPNSDSYDWSLPPLNVGSDEATWEDTIDPINSNGQPAQAAKLTGTAQAAELTGSDHLAQTADNQDIFVSGVLFGVAAAAALAAVLEVLHWVFKIE